MAKGKGSKTKKTTTKKSGLNENERKEVKEIASSLIDEEVENKQAIFERIERQPYAGINFDDVANDPIVARRPNQVNANYYDLLPGISQSLTGEAGRKYNQRIGNEIILKSVDIKGFLEYDQSFATDVNAKNKKLLVRFMVLSQKRSGNFTSAYTNMSSRLLRTATNADENTGPYTGAAINGLQDINRDVYTVHYEKKVYMDAPVLLPGGGTDPSVDVGVNPSTLKFINHKLRFGGKRGLKLKFANSGATVPENFAPFIVVGYSSLSANQVPSNGLVRFTYNVVADYQDA